MLLDQYESQNLLFNTNFKETTSDGLGAYRGELVVVEGEIADAQGRRKPPVVVLRQAIVLAGDTITLFSGVLNDLADMTPLLARYQNDFDPAMKAVVYVRNIKDEMKLELGGIEFLFVGLLDGMVWTELTESLGLEKGDFKGQSAADKLVTVLEGFSDFKSKAPLIASLDEALTKTVEVTWEGRGAI
ncbi:MAG: hypothetical protein COX57_11220 [Alphaproteobacteria bacterium CG_4_10_14_0_2_um_filter_63_37]|nr:MAG: hypothetical protein AUJ55_08665 [Proteobacteria bacterium CG1_02_64_396]PJA23868.1 MAG: hypothetical protein COX57_11220 [Alphaproteobacteria bacterium CG_4_10_14_0_2_um_filter_63_37]